MANSVNLDSSTRLDITCRKGDTFNLTMKVKDANGDDLTVSDITFKMEVRDSDTATNTVIASTSVSYSQSTAGQLTVTIADSVMDDVDGGLYVYDLQATTAAGVVSTWLHGLFIVNEDVTV
jgi:GH43 family beta-xylosidase